MIPWWRRVALWLADLAASCVFCGLHLPFIKDDRMSWHFMTVHDGKARWVCPFCYRNCA